MSIFRILALNWIYFMLWVMENRIPIALVIVVYQVFKMVTNDE